MVNAIKKGKKGEWEFATFLKQYGFDARRGQQHKGTPDSPDVIGLPGFHIEVKRSEYLSIYPAYEKAVEEADPETIPIVAHRKNKKKWLIFMSAEDFVKLIKCRDE